LTHPFAALLADLDALLDGEPPSAVASAAQPAAALVLDGVEFLLSCSRTDCDLLTVFCRFGPLAAPQADALARLLAANLAMAGRCTGMFAMEPDSGSVVYAFHAPLHGMTAADLHRALRETAAQALAWRETHGVCGHGV
jgi:hypothetical protein